MSVRRDTVVHISKIKTEDLDTDSQTIKDLSILSQSGFDVQECFILTNNAFTQFLNENNLKKKISDLLSTVHYDMPESVMQVSNHIKKMVLDSKVPIDLRHEIEREYKKWNSLLKKAKVTVGDNDENFNDAQGIINGIKSTWVSLFDPKNLLDARNHPKIFEGNIQVAVKKVIKSKKYGKLSTMDLKLKTKSKLSGTEEENLIDMAKKIKKHFYLPQIVSWAIEKNTYYITHIRPLT